MALVVGAKQLMARLTQKDRYRPTEMTRRKTPDGTGLLDKLPQRDASAAHGDEAANKKYMEFLLRVPTIWPIDLAVECKGTRPV